MKFWMWIERLVIRLSAAPRVPKAKAERGAFRYNPATGLPMLEGEAGKYFDIGGNLYGHN